MATLTLAEARRLVEDVEGVGGRGTSVPQSNGRVLSLEMACRRVGHSHEKKKKSINFHSFGSANETQALSPKDIKGSSKKECQVRCSKGANSCQTTDRCPKLSLLQS